MSIVKEWFNKITQSARDIIEAGAEETPAVTADSEAAAFSGDPNNAPPSDADTPKNPADSADDSADSSDDTADSTDDTTDDTLPEGDDKPEEEEAEEEEIEEAFDDISSDENKKPSSENRRYDEANVSGADLETSHDDGGDEEEDANDNLEDSDLLENFREELYDQITEAGAEEFPHFQYEDPSSIGSLPVNLEETAATIANTLMFDENIVAASEQLYETLSKESSLLKFMSGDGKAGLSQFFSDIMGRLGVGDILEPLCDLDGDGKMNLMEMLLKKQVEDKIAEAITNQVADKLASLLQGINMTEQTSASERSASVTQGRTYEPQPSGADIPTTNPGAEVQQASGTNIPHSVTTPVESTPVSVDIPHANPGTEVQQASGTNIPHSVTNSAENSASPVDIPHTNAGTGVSEAKGVDVPHSVGEQKAPAVASGSHAHGADGISF